MHQRFIDAINTNPDDRATQLIYADWLDGIGDPRAEAWRVLVEQGKRPCFNEDCPADPWEWHLPFPGGNPDNYISSEMYDACIAWVRCHRDPEFMRESAPA